MHYYKYDCPFRDKHCNDCKKKGHKREFCNMSKGKSNKNNEKFRSTHIVGGTFSNKCEPKRKLVNVNINNFDTILQLDSGSDFTIISSDLFKKINPAITF